MRLPWRRRKTTVPAFIDMQMVARVFREAETPEEFYWRELRR